MRTAIGTIPAMMLEATDRFRKSSAFQYKQHGHWIAVSTDDFVRRVEELFYGLTALSIQPGDRVAILSENRLEWALADYAAQCAGAIVVPVYPTLSTAQIEALLTDCEAKLAFISTSQLLEKVVTSRKRLQGLKYIIAMEPEIYQPGVMRLETLNKIGRQFGSDHPGMFRRSVCRCQPDDVATIIYTSGTTGVPKGAMLTHRNIMANLAATLDVLPLDSSDVELSFLPLSHVFQRHVDYAAMYVGATIAYAQSATTIASDIVEVQPTFAAGVPRFFEKLRERILHDVERSGVVKRLAFDLAIRAGLRVVHSGRKGPAYSIADRVVFQTIRRRLGGRLRWFISGGAVLEQEVAEFFFAIGLPILEGYGLTETSPVITMTAPGKERIGCVGCPVGDVQLQIADDGEILVRGSNVMKGYFRKPYETRDALAGGWFHTGDIGQIDSDGFLRITDRKKDLIVTSSGKKIAPQPIENRLKLSPYFDDIVVVGDRRSFLSALVVPNLNAIADFARSNRIAFREPSQLLENERIHQLVRSEIDRRTADLATFERIHKVALLNTGFSVDGGELTPTLKIRRSVIEEKFRDRIDELYAA